MDQWIDLLSGSTPLFLVCIAILGLIVGSFLNVVIFRYPQMLQRDWAKQCNAYMAENSPGNADKMSLPVGSEPFSLVTPRSQCPHCHRTITAMENIPVFSFIFLKGRCRGCHARISWRYPLIECATALVSVITALHFGVTWLTFWALIFSWSLIALAVIDIDHQFLPDDITLPLLWLGLMINMLSLFTDLDSAVIGACAGYVFLWLIYWAFKLLTGKEGMGYGDFKLLAMLGAWLGWRALPQIILISSFAGAVIGVALIVAKRQKRSQPIPFGPFLALAGWISLLYGNRLNALYFSIIGLS